MYLLMSEAVALWGPQKDASYALKERLNEGLMSIKGYIQEFWLCYAKHIDHIGPGG